MVSRLLLLFDVCVPGICVSRFLLLRIACFRFGWVHTALPVRTLITCQCFSSRDTPHASGPLVSVVSSSCFAFGVVVVRVRSVRFARSVQFGLVLLRCWVVRLFGLVRFGSVVFVGFAVDLASCSFWYMYMHPYRTSTTVSFRVRIPINHQCFSRHHSFPVSWKETRIAYQLSVDFTLFLGHFLSCQPCSFAHLPWQSIQFEFRASAAVGAPRREPIDTHTHTHCVKARNRKTSRATYRHTCTRSDGQRPGLNRALSRRMMGIVQRVTRNTKSRPRPEQEPKGLKDCTDRKCKQLQGLAPSFYNCPPRGRGHQRIPTLYSNCEYQRTSTSCSESHPDSVVSRLRQHLPVILWAKHT
jgi:hypothetical protein